MQLHPRITRATLDFAARFEGLRRKAARLPEGEGWTVGYGHSRTAREGVSVTPADARALLAWDLSQAAAVLDSAVYAPLNPNQFDALCDFCFNVGEEAFRTSEVLRRLNEGKPLQAAAALEMWRRAKVEGHSLVVDAVVRRRAAEKALFLTPPEGFPAAPTPVLRPELDRRLTYETDWLAVSDETPVAAFAPLDGEDASPVLGGPPRLAVEEAMDAVTARLARIREGAPSRETASEPAPAAAEPEPPPFLAEPAAAGPFAPEGETPPRPAPPQGPAAHDARRPFPPRREVPARPRRAAWTVWLEAGLIWGAIALIGLVLFGVAAVCILDRPTVGCWLVGLLGVLAMTPYTARLLSRGRR